MNEMIIIVCFNKQIEMITVNHQNQNKLVTFTSIYEYYLLLIQFCNNYRSYGEQWECEIDTIFGFIH